MTSLLIIKNHLQVDYSFWHQSKTALKTARNEVLEKIYSIIITSLPKDELQGTFNKKNSRYIFNYKCKNKETPINFSFYLESDRSTAKGMVLWNGKEYSLSSDDTGKIKQLIFSHIKPPQERKFFEEVCVLENNQLVWKEIDRVEIVGGPVKKNYDGIHHDSHAPLLVRGDKFEFIRTESKPELVIEDWSRWESEMVTAASAYEDKIHPLYAQYVAHIITNIGKPVQILDLGGGSGRLAELILNKSQEQIQHYSLLEFNEDLCRTATGRLKDKDKVVIRQADARSPQVYKDYDGVNIILTCGLLTEQVLCYDDQLVVLDHISKIAKPGTWVIIGGLAKTFITERDLNKRNWRALNLTDPDRLFPFQIAIKESD